MKHRFAFLIPVAFALSACGDTSTTGPGAGAAVGGVLGAVAATAFGADTEWLIIGTLAGATAGSLIAQNQSTGQCRYADGRGGTYTAPCQ